jgi:hypothetical protein
MKLLALVKGPASISRYLAKVGEATEVPRRSPGRGPPYWKSRVLRLKLLGDEDGATAWGGPRCAAACALVGSAYGALRGRIRATCRGTKCLTQETT